MVIAYTLQDAVDRERSGWKILGDSSKKTLLILKHNGSFLSDLCTAVTREGFVDFVNIGGDRLEAGIKSVEPFLLNLLKCLLGLLSSLSCCLKFCNERKQGEKKQKGTVESECFQETGLMWKSDHENWSEGIFTLEQEENVRLNNQWLKFTFQILGVDYLWSALWWCTII